jgi:hypothetical protein
MPLRVTLGAPAADLGQPINTDQTDHPAADIEKAACIVIYVAICRRFPPGAERERWHAWLARLQSTPNLPLSKLLAPQEIESCDQRT